jgi:hypothetical protein
MYTVFQECDFTDHILVLVSFYLASDFQLMVDSSVPFQPAVSVGNVGQLAVDLLVQNLHMDKVGYFSDDSFLPVIGNDPFASDPKSSALMTAAEGDEILCFLVNYLICPLSYSVPLCQEEIDCSSAEVTNCEGKFML